MRCYARNSPWAQSDSSYARSLGLDVPVGLDGTAQDGFGSDSTAYSAFAQEHSGSVTDILSYRHIDRYSLFHFPS